MEVEHEEFRRDGFFFDVQSFRLDLYRLLSCFFASAEFARLRARLRYEKVADIGDEFEEYEVTRLLVNIAAKVRMIQDRDMEHPWNLTGSCGKFTPDLSKPRRREDLSLREACNKIIHAKHFKFDIKKLKVRDGEYTGTVTALRPYIHLYGEKQDVSWKATLNIVEFSKIGAIHVRG